MVDHAFCGNCGMAISPDDRFCGECGTSQEAFAIAADKEERLFAGEESPSPDRAEDAQGAIAIDADRPAPSAEPILRENRVTEKSSPGFWDAVGTGLDAFGTMMELLVRGAYIVICAVVAVLAFQNGEPVIGGGAIAYGLYILAGGSWFVY